MSGNCYEGTPTILESPVVAGENTTNRRSSFAPNFNKIKNQQPLIDLIVAMITLPSLIIFALLLEANMREEWTDEAESRWTVLGLGVALLLVSLILCGYTTHRMGVCLWAGPLDGEYGPNMSRLNSEANIQHMIDNLPPSYDTVMGFDIPPPSYECVVKLTIIDEKQPIPGPDVTIHL